VKLNTYHSPPCSAEVNNELSYNANPPVCLHGVDREIFIFAVVPDIFVKQVILEVTLVKIIYMQEAPDSNVNLTFILKFVLFSVSRVGCPMAYLEAGYANLLPKPY
jgi:hypothetical protein